MYCNSFGEPLTCAQQIHRPRDSRDRPLLWPTSDCYRTSTNRYYTFAVQSRVRLKPAAVALLRELNVLAHAAFQYLKAKYTNEFISYSASVSNVERNAWYMQLTPLRCPCLVFLAGW